MKCEMNRNEMHLNCWKYKDILPVLRRSLIECKMTRIYFSRWWVTSTPSTCSWPSSGWPWPTLPSIPSSTSVWTPSKYRDRVTMTNCTISLVKGWPINSPVTCKIRYICKVKSASSSTYFCYHYETFLINLHFKSNWAFWFGHPMYS